MKAFLPLCSLLVLLVGCKTSQDFSPFLNQPLEARVYNLGQPAREWTILPSGNEHRLLVSWVTGHQTGWKGSWVTHAPSILISGTNFTMNVHSNRVIINAGGKQCVRAKSASDLEFLRHEPGT